MIAIKLYGPPGPLNPDALPAEWPSEVNPNCSSLPPGYSLSFETWDEYEAYRAKYLAAYNAAREAARIAAEANPPVPFAVSRRQLFLALAAIGVTRAAIRAMIEATPDAAAREAGLIEFDEAIHFERAHPLIAQLGAALGRSESQIDDLFRSAANL